MLVESLQSLDLARFVRPGDGVIFQQGCGEALSLGEAFVAQRAAYRGASVFFGSGFSRTFQPEHADLLRFSGIGGIGTLRKLASAGVLDPIPCHISAIDGLLREGIIRADVVMLQLSPPNERGQYSFGLPVIDGLEQLAGKLMLLQQVAEIHDGGAVRQGFIQR